ncbi:MAG TPA: DEAD/DEAH box helicase family protein [Desulfitobacterium dehalogenans]|uniref:DEAD/DEAH box helicase family protein n=1 Tax=Desulfitobacterium dehalogenans TaxID=36854 RepID=A0A7C7D995_9FIRM|nr:DEAD/DEAH box helicase family protein [Desulfitobacterium dehalogenans]
MTKLKRTKAVEKLNLSEHTLDINIRKCNYEKFRFSEIEDYVRAVTGGREYQYQAIKCTMIYLWGGGYKNVTELATENFAQKKHLKERFGSEEILIGHLPLSDRLSGVVHMATGTGKSYVIFAIAYLSLVMGLTKRVLVLGPSSTIIEEDLREKFLMFMGKKEWNDKLPRQYQGKEIDLLTNNDVIEDGSITIENINAIYTVGGIRDTIFNDTKEILVLGDEIHHAYSHLNFNKIKNELEFDRINIDKGRDSDEKTERLWMKFLKEHSEITRHIGFTGTPYNKDDYFADVIFDYNIRTAIDQYQIKDINPIINVETDEGEMEWTTEKRFTIVLKKHLENTDKYAYKREDGKRRVKPITVFYCPTQNNAKIRSEEFIKFLTKWMQEKGNVPGSESEIELIAREKVICVISDISQSEYKNELNSIEETDPTKVGGKTEYVFSVGKLLEGWDVDNVFQIVPMEERVFNSKLLISQVLGRGLRIPRKIYASEVHQTYPCLTVTNHEKFADHIKELMDAVTNSDMYILSEPLKVVNEDNWRGRHHYSLFNLRYNPSVKLQDVNQVEQLDLTQRELILTKYKVDQTVLVERIRGTERYELKKRIITIDSLVDTLYRRFKGREYEGIHFDFGNGDYKRCPEEDEIRETIVLAMEKAGISESGLTEENRKQIDLFFNQFLPRGKKKRIFENIRGDIERTITQELEVKSIRVGELERNATVFISESYKQEVDEKTKAVLKYLVENRKPKEQKEGQVSFSFIDSSGLLNKHKDYVRPLVENDDRPPYIVNTSVFKTPLSTIIISHNPEKEFVFRLLEHSAYLESWIKSPDKGFYSIDYEYWKRGKDRVRRGFNPDFFIKIDLEKYCEILKNNNMLQYQERIKELQDKGIKTIIRVVEIKSDEDDDEATSAKKDWAKMHFSTVNEIIQEALSNGSNEINQIYTFDILTPDEYDSWFKGLKEGKILK